MPSAEAVFAADLDVLAPCPLGGVIDAEGAERLNCRIVCGPANNPLTTPEVAAVLTRRGILYVPDFLANCGGLIHADAERQGAGGGEGLGEALATNRLAETIAEGQAWARIQATEGHFNRTAKN